VIEYTGRRKSKMCRGERSLVYKQVPEESGERRREEDLERQRRRENI
jgi:hypothetical protein